MNAHFSAYRIFEQDAGSAGRFVELMLDDLDPGEVVIHALFQRMRSRPVRRGRGAKRKT